MERFAVCGVNGIEHPKIGCSPRRRRAHLPAMLTGGRLAVVFASALVATVVVVTAGSLDAVETPISISNSALDFGSIAVGSSSERSVNLTNTGGDAFGPITIFGGAIATAEFSSTHFCTGATLQPGGSCQIFYTFTPSAAGTLNDVSNFVISETNSQSDGEAFSVSLTGSARLAANLPPAVVTAVVTPDDSTATTISTVTTTTTAPTTTTSTTATATTGAGTATAGSTGDAPGDSPSPAETTTVARQVLTGIVEPGPAVVVKVDNVEAGPQSGLNQADVVFEEIVEGQQTRFAAVFNSARDVNPVGPIRSARTQDVNLLLSLNDPAIVYSGANEGVDAALQNAGFELFGEATAGVFRAEDREAPHNLFANLSAIWPQIVSSGDAVPAFDYVEPGQAVGGTPVTFASMMVGSNDVRWDWNDTLGLFLRSQLGGPHQLTDGQATAKNVVVLVVDYGASPAGGGPEAQTLGTERAVVYSDGQRIEGTWQRANPTDPFTLLDAGGAPILLAPGRTWVELVDTNNNLTDG
jgi:hypothetical protein